MSAWSDSPAALLLRLKWRGFWRKQWRRLRTPSGALLALLGGGLALAWTVSLAYSMFRPGRSRVGPEDAELIVQAGLAVIILITLSSSLSFRGLYVPAGEIESLFSAPLSRPALIRMRLSVALVRSALGALFAGLGAARLGTSPLFAFCGAFTAFLWAPVVGQGAAILLGDAENRIAARLARAPHRALRAVLLGALVVAVVSLFSKTPDEFGEGARSPLVLLREFAAHPVTAAFLAPFWPWARTVSATNAGEFWPAFALCLAILFGSVALVSSLRVDFRETALATSADMARRLARMRRGLGAGGVEARKLPMEWRTPWLFGRGPFGAVAFRKCASILRRARGGLLFGVVVIAAVTLFAARLVEEPGEGWHGALMVASFGTFYLSLGLRYDFREELDALPAIRSWPLAPWKIFVATIAPQVLLVTSLVSAGVLVTLVRASALDGRAVVFVAVLALVVATWVSIDNVAFLFAPTRAAPGQDGMLQNVGRSLVLALLRSITMLAALAAAAAPALVAVELFDWPFERAWPLAAACGAALLLVEWAALVALGGLALRRFDVAREH